MSESPEVGLCPVCLSDRGVEPAAPRGPWERLVLARLGRRPYLCAACGHRRVLAARRVAPATEAPAPVPFTGPRRLEPTPGPPAPSGRDEFQDLIHQMRRKEEVLTGKTATRES